MLKYRYLYTEEQALPYVDGGVITLRTTARYRQEEHSGIYTPSELKTLRGRGSQEHLERFDKMVQMTPDATGGVMGVGKVIFDDGILEAAAKYNAPGLVLCLCNTRTKASDELWQKQGKRYCVAIPYVNKLFHEISEQLGIGRNQYDDVGDQLAEKGRCKYTSGHERDVFTKSDKDGWQDEYRLHWRTQTRETTVALPRGTGKIVWIARD